jgi:hypothetical protein
MGHSREVFLGAMMALMLKTGQLFDRPTKQRRMRKVKVRRSRLCYPHQSDREKARRLRQLEAGILPRDQFLRMEV